MENVSQNETRNEEPRGGDRINHGLDRILRAAAILKFMRDAAGVAWGDCQHDTDDTARALEEVVGLLERAHSDVDIGANELHARLTTGAFP